MASIEPRISKLGAAGTTKHITITETLEIVRKPGTATNQCHFGSIQHWIVYHLWYKET